MRVLLEGDLELGTEAWVAPDILAESKGVVPRVREYEENSRVYCKYICDCLGKFNGTAFRAATFCWLRRTISQLRLKAFLTCDSIIQPLWSATVLQWECSRSGS